MRLLQIISYWLIILGNSIYIFWLLILLVIICYLAYAIIT